MNCNKCGGAIPDESKFCPHCGAMQTAPKKDIFCMECGLMLQAGTMFCPVCGTPVEGAKPSAQAIPAAPAASMPAVSGEMGTVSAIPQPVSQSVPQPVSQSIPQPVSQSIPQPVSQSIPQPVQEAKPSDAVFGAFNAAYGSEPKPSDIAFAKPSDAVFGAGSVSLEKPSDTAFAAQPEEARAYTPEQTSAPLTQTTLTKKKGKKWVGPVIGAAAAAAVVGGGAIVYNFNKADITNMVMGDSAYARMIEQGSVKKLADSADSAVISQAAGNVMAAAASSNLSKSNIENIEDAAYDAMSGDFGAIVESQSGSEKKSLSLRPIIEQLYGQMIELTGYSGAEVKIGVEAKITETLRALITEGESEENDMLNEILDMVNSAELQFSVLSAKDSVSMYGGLNDTSAGFSFGASGVMYADGTVGIMFPNTSDTAIKYTIEDDGTVTVEQTAMPSIDEKEIERLKNELVDLYLSYYEKGEITVTAEDGIKNIAVKITSEQAAEMIKQAAALIAEDEYFSKTIVDYINANGGSITAEDYKSAIMDSVKDLNPKDNGALIITTSVDKQNNITAKKFAVEATNSYAEMGYKTEGKNTELFLLTRTQQTEELTVLIAAENATDGVVTISFDEYGEAKVENGEEFILDIKYKDSKLEKFGKTQVLTGNYEASARKAVSLDTSDEYDTDTAVLAALQSAKVIFDSRLEAENTIKQSLTLEIPQYGSVTLKVSETLTNDAPEKLPAGAIDLNKYTSEDITEDDINEIMSAIEKLRDDIAAKCSGSKSKFAEYISQGSAELLNSLIDELSPKASEEAINESNARADELNDRCYDISYNYSEILDEELQGRLDDIMKRVNETYLWGDVSLDELIEAKSEQQRLEEEITKLTEDVYKAARESIEKMYNDMDVDELESAIFMLEYMYGYIYEEYSMEIDGDEQLSEAFNEVTDKKQACDEAYDDLERMIDSGNIPVATVRTLKKTAAALEISLTEFIDLLASKIDF